MLKCAVLVDGGHLRALAKKAKLKYEPNLIEKIGHACVHETEALLRVLYYDCAPYAGKVSLPVSGTEFEFKGSDHWLRVLAARDLFAVRRGVLKFRGFKPKRIPISKTDLTDDDFSPDFEQKGVDMRIGLDIANHASAKSVDPIILINADTDCIPAMKQARISGLQVIIVAFAAQKLPPELLWHADFERRIA